MCLVLKNQLQMVYISQVLFTAPYLDSGAGVGLQLEQTGDASLQVGDQGAFCFVPVEGFDLVG